MKIKTVLLILVLIASGTSFIYMAVMPSLTDRYPILEGVQIPDTKGDDYKREFPQTRKVTEEGGGIKEYILKCDPTSQKVVLITCYENGNRTVSPVETINLLYLEKEDIALLYEGIHFKNKEDMFLLIEDYSS